MAGDGSEDKALLETPRRGAAFRGGAALKRDAETAETESWPRGGGDAGARIRARDWSATPLGPLARWPQSLKTAVEICLASAEPVSVLWGPEHIQLYNDAYAVEIARDRHPAIFGRPALENWSDAYEILRPIFDRIDADGTPALLEDYRVPLRRRDSPIPEERFFTFSFAAIRGADGAVAGIFHHVTETAGALRKRDERSRALFSLMAEAYYLVDLLYDENGHAVDYRFIEANPAFEKATGLQNVVGKTGREAAPDLEQRWIDLFAEVARTGEPARVGGRVVGLPDRWYDGYAFRLGSEEHPVIAVIFSETTERKKAEEALRTSEEILSLIYDNSPDCLYLVQVEPNDVFRFVTVNPAFLRISGYSREQVINAPMERVIPPENIALVRSQYKQVMASRGPVTYEETARLPAGVRHAEITLTPIFAADGSVKSIVGVIRDTTERKKTETALVESEKRFRTLADSVPHIIWGNTPTGEVNYYNQRWYEYSGLSYEDSYGRSWEAVLHPDDFAPAVEHWQQSLATGTVWDIEYRLRRKDGVYRWHIGRSVPVRDSDDRIIGWFGSSTDIEDLKQAEAARRESEERFRLLVEGAREYAMYLKDAHDRIIFWSAGAERLFGWTEAEVLGKKPHLLFTPEDRVSGQPEKEMAIARATGQATDRRWHVRKDGSRFWADGLLMRLQDDAGNLRGYAKVTRDATEQKRAEDELRASEEAVRRANEELERRVEQRTEELERMSRMRQELLRQLVRAQEEERARISRDLHDDTGQQMTALLLGLHQLHNCDGLAADQEAQKLLTRLEAHAGDVARKSHRLSFTLRPTDLDDIGLQGALENYLEEWGKWSGVPVDLQSVGMRQADGTPVRLPPEIETTIYRVAQEALTNVLRHAVTGRAARSAGKQEAKLCGGRCASRVTILLQRRAREVLAIVEDDGPGFNVEAALNLPPGKRRLGIFGMQERARLAGGSLTIESSPGKGTTVFLRLPLPSPEQRILHDG